MTVRRLLQRQLIQAWESSIGRDYCNQRINSERSLQASFWSQLNRILPAEKRRMFIEPRFSVKVKKQSRIFYPDIVICNTRKVIAVIEIKYQPRVLPAHDKDLETLRIIAANRKKLHLVNSRFLGPTADATRYFMSDKLLFVWAGVHKTPTVSFQSKDTPMLSHGFRELDGCFLQLHAETDQSNKPNVFARNR